MDSKNNITEQTQQTGSVQTNHITDIDKNILITDEEKKIVKPPIKSEEKKPYISAESYIVSNIETGEVYLSFNPKKVFPIASVSKLYTALVVKHLLDLDKPITLTQSMLDAYGDAGHFTLGEKFTTGELLYPLLLVSSNDIAEAFAQSYGYDDFIKEMNAFAQEIGMDNTSFKDASGLNPGNVSTANDLLVLAKYLYNNENEILKISDTREYDISTTSDHGSHHLVNINPYTFYPEFIGGKTGRTEEAKESMVSLFNKNVDDKTYPLAVIILRSDLGSREIDTEKLLGLFIDKMQKKQ